MLQHTMSYRLTERDKYGYTLLMFTGESGYCYLTLKGSAEPYSRFSLSTEHAIALRDFLNDAYPAN